MQAQEVPTFVTATAFDDTILVLEDKASQQVFRARKLDGDWKFAITIFRLKFRIYQNMFDSLKKVSSNCSTWDYDFLPISFFRPSENNNIYVATPITGIPMKMPPSHEKRQHIVAHDFYRKEGFVPLLSFSRIGTCYLDDVRFTQQQEVIATLFAKCDSVGCDLPRTTGSVVYTVLEPMDKVETTSYKYH